MSNLSLLRFNNYFNRIVKKLNTLSDYAGYVLSNVPGNNPLQDINFNPNDGIHTEQIVNWNGEDPDYIIVSDDAGNIESRWFVIEHERTRGRQYRLFLRRDVIVDFYDDILNAPCFIEKATIPSSSDLIFNSENMTYNQIKQSETLLKDQTGCPWIVIYAARNTHNAETGDEEPTTFSINVDTNYPFTVLSQQQYDELLASVRGGTGIFRATHAKITIRDRRNNLNEFTQLTMTSNSAEIVESIGSLTAPNNGPALLPNAVDILATNAASVPANVYALRNSYAVGQNESLYDFVLNNQNTYLKYTSSTGEVSYYRLSILRQNSGVATSLINNSYTGALTEVLAPIRQAFDNPDAVTIGAYRNISVDYIGDQIFINLESVEAPETTGDTMTISQNRYHCVDAPYDIFTLPLSNSLIITNSQKANFFEYRSDAFKNLQIAGELMLKYSGVGQVFDAQILPYCPLTTGRMTADGKFDLNDASDNIASFMYRANNAVVPVGGVFHVSNASFSLNIPLDPAITISDYKVESECDVYRLCSPNYAGIFEFNAAMNDGVSFFNVACTYKPYTPYIKVYPDFKRMYGDSFNDSRGLILGGDFSLPAMTDAWETYQLQNKNYQVAFDRQIQNLEIHNKMALLSDRIGATAGALSGAASGAAIGSLIMPGIGTAIGAGFGAIASGLGGAADVRINEKLRQEDMDYTKDRFGYELGNIRALPQSLSKTSAYNVDNKYFPFLEYYTCSEVEKQALRDKIKYNGMTAMVIGSIAQFQLSSQKSYIKGRIIRLDSISEAYSVCRAIYDEINKGVYI